MNKTRSVVALCIICAVWIVLSAALALFHGGDVIESERRQAASFPALTANSVLSGEFAEGFEKWSTDRFPLREELRSFKAAFNVYALGKNDNNKITVLDGAAYEINYPINENSVKNAADKINNLCEKYIQADNIYLSVIPDRSEKAAEYTLQPYIACGEYERILCENIKYAKYIDISPLLQREDYYSTDSHWRQEKIFDAAEKILGEMGAESFSKEELSIKTAKEDFFGVYSGRAAVKLNADAVKYVDNAVVSGASVDIPGKGEGLPIYDFSALNGKDPYDFYLYGASGIVKIQNPAAKSGRRLIILRDSYASSLAPLLLKSYSEITLIDIRYISPELIEKYADTQTDDLLIIMSGLLLNSSYTLKG